MIIFIVTLIAFILEYIVNGFFHGTIFTGLIIFSSLVLLEPYFKKDKNKFFIYCFVVGFLYDLVYTGNYFLDAGMFLFIGVLIEFVNMITPNNFIVSMLELILFIFVYRFFSFLFFVINGVIAFSFDALFKSFYCSLLTNILYGGILYFVLYLLSLKFKIRRIK